VRPEVSVVIPTYRRPDTLRLVLDGLAAQDHPGGDFEVVVVCDGGNDGSAEVVRSRRLPCPVRVLQQPNRGPAAARNLGVEQSQGDLVVFLDDDVIPCPHLVAEHCRAHRGRGNLVVIGPLLGRADEPSPWVRWEAAQLARQYEAMRTGRFRPTPWQFYTGNASVRRDHLVGAGGFDVRFRRAEDIELALRLRDRGLEFEFWPAAAGLHVARRSYPTLLAAARQYGRNDVLFGTTEERVLREYRHRHPATRRLIRFGLRHPGLHGLLDPLAAATATATLRLGARRASLAVCSAIFNLHYWLGVHEALGEEAVRLAEWRLAVGDRR
jgi:GT2 family glycosyltransferase